MMKRLLTTTALALCLGGTAAHATMHTVASAGFWETQTGTTNDTNKPMCMIGTAGNNFSFTLKYVSTGLWFDLYHDGWNVPSGVFARVNMTVDSAPGWYIDMGRLATGARGHMSGQIDLTRKRQDSDQLMSAYIVDMIASGNTMRVTFPQGNTEAWNLSLVGTQAVMQAFAQCVVGFDNAAGQPAAGQPYGAQTGQPYGSVVRPKYEYQ
jgi:hypothetical protein